MATGHASHAAAAERSAAFHCPAAEAAPAHAASTSERTTAFLPTKAAIVVRSTAHTAGSEVLSFAGQPLSFSPEALSHPSLSHRLSAIVEITIRLSRHDAKIGVGSIAL